MEKTRQGGEPAQDVRSGRALVLAAVLVGLGLLVLAGALWYGRQSGEAAPSAASAAAPRNVSASFAGSESCRACHQEQFEAWRHSHHGLAERPLTEADREAFDPPRQIPHGSQISEAFVAPDGTLSLRTAGPGGPAVFEPERVIGVAPLLQYLIPDEGGRYQAAELAYDPARKEWFDVFGDEDRQPGEWGHWTGRGMTWNTMCAACHNLGLEKNYDAASDTFATRWVELGVGCESCHGGSAEHVSWQQRHRGEGGDPTLPSLTQEQTMATCASCHSRRSDLTGTFHPGDAFLDHYAPAIPDETEIYYADGQVHEEDYEYVSFLGSKMHAAGVSCLDCHEPHSGQTRWVGNQLCMQCHNGGGRIPAPVIDPAAHSHHTPDTPGGSCVDCHMPQTTYMQRHPRRDHGFTLPDPSLTLEHGIPNACNRCHQDQDAAWAQQKVVEWYGPERPPSHARAEWLAKFRAGDSSVLTDVVAAAREESIPLWRAVATNLLRAWSGDPQARAVLLERSRDPDPLVRAMAARGLEGLAQAGDPAARSEALRLLEDPVRLVRSEAAWTLRSSVATESGGGRDLLEALEFNLDQPTGALRMGVFQLDRGDLQQGLDSIGRAVKLDPRSAPLRREYAVALSRAGRPREAVAQLEQAIRLEPGQAEYAFQLALAWNEAGELPRAAEALQRATRLDPSFGRAWYNLGLAYSSLGENERAVEALQRAESLEPSSSQIPFARATVLARLGQRQAAREAALRAVQLDPRNAEAVRLLQMLSAAP